MLKVKEGIKLEELEKYGFKKQPRPYPGYYRCIAIGPEIIFVTGVREIIVEDWEETEWRIHKNPNCKYRSNETSIDILYDLITAGIVVKE